MQYVWSSNNIGLDCQEIKTINKVLMRILNDNVKKTEMWALSNQWVYSWQSNIWGRLGVWVS